VERIRERVARIGAARLGERVPVPPTRDEIARLAITMNMMLDRLQSAQSAQRQFVADASHELRSPLATFATGLEVAGADPTGEVWRDLRPVMAAEIDRMSVLVEHLLLLARADDRGLELDVVDVDLDDLLAEEAGRLRASTALRIGGRITPVRVNGDPLRLSQVIRNLADNAVRHASGRVELSLRQEGDEAVLTVEDDGPGVPEDQRERVFDRFVRLDESRARASGGSGLGLAIVREVLAAHGGRVWLDAGPLGGARVVVRLPVPSAAGPDVGSEPDTRSEQGAGSEQDSGPPAKKIPGDAGPRADSPGERGPGNAAAADYPPSSAIR
jgi:signal transduction histidine kinase